MNLIDTLWQNAPSIPQDWPRGIIALDSPASVGSPAPAPHNEGRGIRSTADGLVCASFHVLDTCADTISNAENENNDLSAIILLRIAFHFGEPAIEPVRQLYLCRHNQGKATVAERLRDILGEIEAA